MVLMRAIASGDQGLALSLLAATLELAVTKLSQGAQRSVSEDFFFADCHTNVYAGDTALHVAAFAYETMLAQHLVAVGADVHARNRRCAQPLHAAAIGSLTSMAMTHKPKRFLIAEQKYDGFVRVLTLASEPLVRT